jgi:exportin-2 (importin alpha re-exporter)
VNNWKAKDCAIYLVVALTVRGATTAKGATTVNSFVNVGEFFAAHIQPEVLTPAGQGSAFLKADALKFITTFRSQIPKVLLATHAIMYFWNETRLVVEI